MNSLEICGRVGVVFLTYKSWKLEHLESLLPFECLCVCVCIGGGSSKDEFQGLVLNRVKSCLSRPKLEDQVH